LSDFLSRRVAAAEQAREKQAKDRQSLWQEIQTKAPGMARDLKALSAVFGKVQLISVEFNEKG
jgi:hypothetical protein